MTTNNELIERLRHIASKGVSVWGDLQMEAADALESQSKQIEALCLALETERGAANLYAKQILHWINKNDEKLELMAALQDMAKQDKALIRQMLDAMVPVSLFGRVGSRDIEQVKLQEAIAAARARLGEGGA